MVKCFIIENLDLIENELKNSKNCNCYCYNTPESELDRIINVESFKHKKKGISISSFNSKKDKLLFLIAISSLKLNAKFKFNRVRFFFEIIHLYLEVIRLASNSCTISSSKKLVEFDSNLIFNKEDYIFYPSLKKYLMNFTFKFISIKHLYRCLRGSSYLEKYLKSKKTLLFYILYFPVKIMGGMFSILIEKNHSLIINTNGSMNIINRVISLTALHYNYEVILKDHGLVRDCVAEVGIFSKSIGYKNQKGPKQEICE